MVAGPEPELRKKSPVNLLQQREFVYTLPSGEQVIIKPYKQGRGVVELPPGTEVEVKKLLDQSTKYPHNA